jgi:3-oxoadipate enol-lactonase
VAYAVIVETSRGDISVLDTGDGHPVLLMHPLALSKELWRPLIEPPQGLRFLALDARGHGQTPWDGKPFSVDDMAADAAALLEALGLPRAAAVGLSMGGTTAAMLAAQQPQLVSSLVLIDTTACYGEDRVTEWEDRAVRASSVARAEQIEFQIERWFSVRTVEQNPDVVGRVSAIFEATDSLAHAAACRALGGVDVRGLLGFISAPTLVIVGAEDFATPPAMAQRLHAGIPGSRLEILDHARHLSVMDEPRAWSMVTEHITSTTREIVG